MFGGVQQKQVQHRKCNTDNTDAFQKEGATTQTFKLTATKLPSSEITRLVDCSNTLTLDVSNAMYNMLPCLNFSFFKVLEEDNGLSLYARS